MRDEAEDEVEVVEGLADHGDVVGADLAGVDGRVQAAHQVEEHAEAARRVHVVQQVRVELGRAPPPPARRRRDARRPP